MDVDGDEDYARPHNERMRKIDGRAIHDRPADEFKRKSAQNIMNEATN